jgi:hypothetical protein
MRVLTGMLCCLLLVAAAPASARFVNDDFRTTHTAIVCEILVGGRHNLHCWRPRDGFTAIMQPHGRLHFAGYSHFNQGRVFQSTLVRYGHRAELSGGFTCMSRRSGLSCHNLDGHGWRMSAHGFRRH